MTILGLNERSTADLRVQRIAVNFHMASHESTTEAQNSIIYVYFAAVAEPCGSSSAKLKPECRSEVGQWW
jgi:hypothetical protein